MIVRVLRAFEKFSEGQIIETNKYLIPNTTIQNYIENGVVQIVQDSIEKLDEVSSDLIYYGTSYGGALETDPVWTIQKTTVNGPITTRETFHDVAWSERATL